MATIMLIRHGQASYGEPDYDKLSSRGIEQAKLVGALLSTLTIDKLFTGPLVRQVGTATHAREVATNLPAPVVIDGFAEFSGLDIVKAFMPRLVAEQPELAAAIARPTRELADRAFKMILAKWSRDEWQAVGVERVSEFAVRVQAALMQVITSCGRGERVAVVTSGGVIGVATGLVFGATAHHMIRASLVVKNASISELKVTTNEFAWDPDKLTLALFNSVAHIPADLHTEF
jgi:broad specificity phosphatase PhoE